MERTYLEPAGIAPPPEPYSHAIQCGDTLYIAGQVAFDEASQVVGIGDPRAQAERVWHNIRLAVEAAVQLCQESERVAAEDFRVARAYAAAHDDTRQRRDRGGLAGGLGVRLALGRTLGCHLAASPTRLENLVFLFLSGRLFGGGRPLGLRSTGLHHPSPNRPPSVATRENPSILRPGGE